MNKLLVTAFVIAAAASATDASAVAPNRNFPYWYLGLTGGVATQNDSDVEGNRNADIEWDSGKVFSASIGYQPPSFGGFRIEGEYSFHQQDVSNGDGDIKVNVGAANLYYDFRNSTGITPYIGGGVGYADFHLGNSNPIGASDDSKRFIYQGLVGIGYEPASVHNVGLSLGYRYMAAFDDPYVKKMNYEYDNHSVEAGIKFRF